MTSIFNCCYPNLNQRAIADEQLGEDITNELTIGTSPINLLMTINNQRRLIKLYTIEYSNPSAKLWVKHGLANDINSFAFALPAGNHLYINTSQASQPLSVFCSSGTAKVKLTIVNSKE